MSSPVAPLPPGPGRPHTWQMLRYQREPLAYVDACARRYGPVFTMRLPFLGTSVAAVDPDDVRTILTRAPERFPKAQGQSPLTPMVGEHATMFVTGDAHRHQRKTMLGVFSGGIAARWGAAIERIAEEEIARLPMGEPVALLPAARRIAFGVICRTVIGELDPRDYATMQAEVGRSDDPRLALMLLAPTLWDRGGPLNPGRAMRRRRETLNRMLFEEIARRRARADEHDARDDVLSLLVRSEDAYGQPLSDLEIRDQLVGLVILGHEITSAGIAWPFERLSRVPAARERLEEELAAGDETYLEAVVHETLRLRSPILDAPRTTTEPIELGGHVVPAGMVVSAMCAVTQRNPAVWEDPLAFRPERFLGDRPAPYAFTPYGGGVRRCIAASLTMLLMETVVRLVVERATVTAAFGPEERSRLYGLALLPSRGARVVLHPRRLHSARSSSISGGRVASQLG
jgi:cytochrome P450 family 135